MARTRIKNGNIYAITLPGDLGFAYAKCIKLLEIYPDCSYPILIRVYNYRTPTLTTNLEKFIYKDLILCPLLIAGISPAVREGSWILVGHVPVTEEETIIPHYKRGEPDDKPKNWYYVPEAAINKKVKTQFDAVKHLETLGAKGSELVGTKIAMALLQDEGKEITQFIPLDEFYQRHYYEEVTSIPAFYKQPNFMKGKALEL
ncbi:Imm26 family immunity protein [Desertivirga brevis]|uniref:Imm26 family immunity protein n=1 Tax=Desertivirga brevis TaxID=2810310 RepID=UPI001A95CAA5|nr:Imm26 family immunity protein [Pedobacter sp. SYSU D00873]